MEKNHIEGLINDRTYVKVFIVNGYQLRGRIIDQSDKAIILKADKTEKLIYKHAISTIEPVEE